MMRSLFSGVAGLKTHQTKMDVIGNNIANVNTVAFKSSSTTFQDLMYQTTSQASGASATRGGTNAKQIGLGVSNGATKVSVTSAGAAQSTGDALDIRLTDTKSTNFFVVNNGTENLFTRAGSFYVDGQGNLAMTTTGYLVQGWQVDAQGKIVKDTVSPLKVMAPANLTSSPEATTIGTFSGVLDKNDTAVTSSQGYIRTLSFYDSLGYSYTAKFAINVKDATAGTYTMKLTNVFDDKNNDILASYVGDDPEKLKEIFGQETTEKKTYGLNSSFEYSDSMWKYIDADGNKYAVEPVTTGGGIAGDPIVVSNYNFTKLDDTGHKSSEPPKTIQEVFGTTDVKSALSKMFGISTEDIDKIDGTEPGAGFTLPSLSNGANATLAAELKTIAYELKFDTKTGLISQSGDTPGITNLMLNTSLLGPYTQPTVQQAAAISDINLDMSGLLNYDNGGTSTVVADRGDADGVGAGKKLGTMTGLSVDGTGKIFGSYSNGNTVLLGQIVVAQFANASGLEEMGENCYKTTLNSGEFDGIGLDVSADGSSMATGQLEMSNVDLSAEFTDMIVTQRGFQANSRIITVSDTLLEELINLKR